jgi:nucleoside 2-deoxyribosyltransferase
MVLYLASGLFNSGERLHNLYLEKYLRMLGYEVILPQREALNFFDGERFNLAGIVNDCQTSVCNSKNLFVGNSDGADTDGGTCVEYGMAIVATGRAIIYRTDFRTDPEKEIGVNAMLGAKKTIFIYFPAYFTELDEAEIYYKNLSQKIHETIQQVVQ